MRRRIWTLIITLIFLSTAIMAQDEERVFFYSKSDYAPIGDMSNIEVAMSNSKVGLPLMRRYYDEVYEAHPSVLANINKPTHYVVIGKEWETVREQFEVISNYYTPDITRYTKIILLYSGKINVMADTVSSVMRMCDALYTTEESGEDAIDILVQSFWSGREIDSSNSVLVPEGMFGARQEKTRLSYQTKPDSVLNLLASKIDEIANKAIDVNATPGLSVMVVQHGNVVVDKQYGYTTYQKTNEVDKRTVYDIASLSKVVGTLPQIIRLFDLGQLKATHTLSSVLGVRGWQGRITVSQLLLHTSGLPAGVPLFALSVDSSTFTPPLLVRRRGPDHQQRVGKNLYLNKNVQLRKGYFSEEQDSLHHVQVGRSLYASDSLSYIIWRHISNLVQSSAKYRYSDINFLYLQKIAEKKFGKPLDEQFDISISKPLGLSRMTYAPQTRFRLSEVAPTADDTYFRKEMVWTTVHDETAAALGGVAGNAGLFATANEVAKIGQLYLNGGTYGGVRLFSQDTFDQFIVRHDPYCRRGYGFDMPDRTNGRVGPVPDCMPKTSYGHTGFTGTMLWMDPERGVVFVFMSNRIHPSVDNTKLTQCDIRTKMLEAITRFLHP